MRFVRAAYLTLLGLNGAFALLLGLNALRDFPAAMASFDVLYNDTMAPVGTILASQFLLQAAFLFLAIRWTTRWNPAGAATGVAVGVYLVFLTVVELAAGRGELALIADAPRGALLAAFGLGVGWVGPADGPGRA